MGFKDVRRRAIAALKSGAYSHATRSGTADENNWLLAGKVTTDEVVDLLGRCRGDHPHYEASPLHENAKIDIHIFKPRGTAGAQTCVWYIKFYIIEPDVTFFSVHPSDKAKP